MDLGKLTTATCYTFLNRIGFCLTETGESNNSIIVEYYPRLGSFTPQGNRVGGPFSFHRMPASRFTRWRWGDEEVLYASHPTANKFMECFASVGTDDGMPYQGVLQTAWFDFGDPLHTKYLREIRVLCAGRFQVLVYRNFSMDTYRTINVDASGIKDQWDTSEFWGFGNWGAEDPVRDLRKTNVDAYGQYFSFRFVDNFDTDTNFQTDWIGSHGRDLVVGEWAIYGLVAETSVLGKRG